MVAAVTSWHEHHDRACREIENRLQRKHRMIVAGPALIEAYAVLTRLTAPHRIAPTDAMSLLDANFIQGIRVAALAASEYATSLRTASAGSVSGGQIYDALIAACARKAGVNVLLTFNEKHFSAFAGDDLEVVVP